MTSPTACDGANAGEAADPAAKGALAKQGSLAELARAVRDAGRPAFPSSDPALGRKLDLLA